MCSHFEIKIVVCEFDTGLLVFGYVRISFDICFHFSIKMKYFNGIASYGKNKTHKSRTFVVK